MKKKEIKVVSEIDKEIANYASEIRKRRLSDLDLISKCGRSRSVYDGAVRNGRPARDLYIMKKAYEMVCKERGVYPL